MARTFNESKCVFLAGPIEFWWNTPSEPDRWNSMEAVKYRWHRDAVRDFFVARHFLVYMPHEAFKGDWNEKMQPVNDFVLSKSDIFVNMKPLHIPGLIANGTDHEEELARELGKIIVPLPPTSEVVDRPWEKTFNPSIVEMILETERIEHGW
jgi:hypothetical protein